MTIPTPAWPRHRRKRRLNNCVLFMIDVRTHTTGLRETNDPKRTIYTICRWGIESTYGGSIFQIQLLWQSKRFHLPQRHQFSFKNSGHWISLVIPHQHPLFIILLIARWKLVKLHFLIQRLQLKRGHFDKKCTSCSIEVILSNLPTIMSSAVYQMMHQITVSKKCVVPALRCFDLKTRISNGLLDFLKILMKLQKTSLRLLISK